MNSTRKIRNAVAGLLAAAVTTAAFATMWPQVNITGNKNRLLLEAQMDWDALMAMNQAAYNYQTFDAFVEYPQFFVQSDIKPDSRCNQTIKNITGTTTANSDPDVQKAKAQLVVNKIKQDAGANAGWWYAMPVLNGYYGPNGSFASGKGFTLIWADGSSSVFVMAYGATIANPTVDRMISGSQTSPPPSQGTNCAAVT